MIQNGMGNELGKLYYWLFVPTWEDRMGLIERGPQGKILGIPRCGSLLENLELHSGKFLIRGPSFFIHFQTIITMTSRLGA